MPVGRICILHARGRLSMVQPRLIAGQIPRLWGVELHTLLHTLEQLMFLIRNIKLLSQYQPNSKADAPTQHKVKNAIKRFPIASNAWTRC